jgi:hypothetical protein
VDESVNSESDQGNDYEENDDDDRNNMVFLNHGCGRVVVCRRGFLVVDAIGVVGSVMLAPLVRVSWIRGVSRVVFGTV